MKPISDKERAKRRQRSRDWYYKNREHALAYAAEYHRKNRDRWMHTRGIHRRKLREAVVAKLGAKCARCGFADTRILQVDHVQGDGGIERKKPGMSNGSTPKYLRTILEDTTGRYQLLCPNCNWQKYFDEERPRYKREQRWEKETSA